VSSGDATTFLSLGARFLGPEIATVEECSVGPLGREQKRAG
jgi:hypothetical protein